MPTFPNFPKELLSDVEEEEEGEVEADATRPTTIHTVTKEKKQIGPGVDEEKIESVNIEPDQEGEEINLIFAPTKPVTTPVPPPSIAPISKQDSEINKLINDLTKSDHEEDKVLINSLKSKQHYKDATLKTTCSN
ncbi:hypothetical protein J1N35_013892 [Gossypium stocksii]|uniref:Uncharacterized protein n=1 Tax=Gossypium stocksii TaxID=47602 RepID=A0A9D3VUQ3_9ROSI|nr:hypothetical protein J1N35_013892 [Gossypium stocksii]